MPRQLWCATGFLFLMVCGACGESPATPTPPDYPVSPGTCGDTPDTTNAVVPLFSRPFTAEYPLTNYFDHDTPAQFQNTDRFVVTWCGQRIAGRIDGHSGYDWIMPVGTPLLATTDGTVVFAGLDPPFYCPPLGVTVSNQLVVTIRSEGSQVFDSQYLHLSQLGVTAGQQVLRGSVIGLSGNTGCSTTPHLHFQVRARTGGTVGALVDPYGWEGRGTDPWAVHVSGHGSVWLWRPGEAPLLRLQ